MEVEVVEHLCAVGISEAHVLVANIAPAFDEVDGAWLVGDLSRLVQYFVYPVGRGRSPLAVHDDHAELSERGLEYEHICLESEQSPDSEMVVDDQEAPIKEDYRQPHPGKVFERRSPRTADVRVLDVGPLQLVGGPSEGGELLLLGGERFHHPDTRDIFLDEHGNFRQPRLNEPGNGVDPLSHRHPDHEGDR